MFRFTDRKQHLRCNDVELVTHGVLMNRFPDL